MFGTVLSETITITNPTENITCSSSTEPCIISCESVHACSSSTINCPSDANCDIDCIADDACLYAKINWPINGQGTLNCHGSYSCYFVNFPIPPPNEDYLLICNETESCAHSIIYCPLNANCHIICSGDHSCFSSTIYWSTNSTSINSTITCNDDMNSCLDTTRPPIYPIDDNEDLDVICGNSSCVGSLITCPSNAQCSIICDGYIACYYATFILPKNESFNIQCVSGAWACSHIIYQIYDDYNPLILNCSSSHMCDGSIIQCPNNADCNITCNGEYSCYSIVVHCPLNDGYYCNIWCNGANSCHGATINGNGRVLECGDSYSCYDMLFPIPPNDEMFELACNDNYFMCSNSKIVCPTDEECHIICNGTSSCISTSIIWPTDQTYLEQSTLYCDEIQNSCDDTIELDTNNTFLTPDDGDVICDYDHECQQRLIVCSGEDFCNIECSGYYSCNGARISAIYYSVNCEGNSEGTCQSVIINTQQLQSSQFLDFTLHCNGKYQCRFATVYCPKSASCNIICGGDVSACDRMTIYGPTDNPLTLTCNTSDACYKATVYAQHVSLFTLNWNVTNPGTDLTIYAPENDDGNERFVINVANSNQFGVIIYAINGWNDVQIIKHDNLWIHHAGIMFCSSDFSINCHFMWNEFKCSTYGDIRCDRKDIIEQQIDETSTTNLPETTVISSSSNEILSELEIILISGIGGVVIFCIVTILIVMKKRKTDNNLNRSGIKKSIELQHNEGENNEAFKPNDNSKNKNSVSLNRPKTVDIEDMYEKIQTPRTPGEEQFSYNASEGNRKDGKSISLNRRKTMDIEDMYPQPGEESTPTINDKQTHNDLETNVHSQGDV